MALATLHNIRTKAAFIQQEPRAPWPPSGDAIFEIDVSVEEKYTHKAVMTSHPIEVQAKLDDHRLIEPVELKITGIVSSVAMKSEARLNSAGELVREPVASPSGSIPEAYDQLVRMFEQSDVFDVLTGLAYYRSMHFKSLDVVRDKSTGGILKFTAELRKIDFANSTAAAPSTPKVADKPKAAPKENHGAKVAKPSNNRSVLRKAAQHFSDNPGQAVRNLLNGL